jgi:hypothetical protein
LHRDREKSAVKSCRVKHFPGLLVLRGAEEDSPKMAQKIGAHDTEFVLRQILRGAVRAAAAGPTAVLVAAPLRLAPADAVSDAR